MSAKPAAKYLKDYQAPSHVVDNLALTFELDPHQTIVTAQSNWRADQANVDLILDGVELELQTLEVNGQPHKQYELKDNRLTLRDLPEAFSLKVVTSINPAGNTSLEGLYQSSGAYCTQCEAEGFRKITYFLDRPDVLTTYTVKIIAPQTVPYLLSNGNKVTEGTLEDGRHFAVWEDPYRKPSYLFALVAGDFDVLRDSFTTMSGRDVALELFVDKGNLGKAGHAMDSLKKAMKWDEERFNLEYDLDVYMIVAVDFFNMGAMENKGLNIFNSACVLANQETATDRDYHTIESIVGHEYFHNWTGNRITCRDWFQLSLKEGLTVFRDQEFSSDLGSRGLNRIDAVNAMRTHQFAEDAGPMAHPIRPEKVIEMNNFYTVTVYNKGAEVIRMLHTLLGESGFQKGMALYVERHDGEAATCDDFVNAMSAATGVNLSHFQAWYREFGTPTIIAKGEYKAETKQYHLHLEQLNPKNNPNMQPLHIPVAIQLLDASGMAVKLVSQDEVVGEVLNLTQKKQSFIFEQLGSEPVVVLLEDFSAPVNVKFEQSLEHKLHILKYARSDYSRWEAMQQIFVQAIVEGVNDNSFMLPEAVIETFKQLLTQPTGDLALLSELLTLPTFDSVASQFDIIPVDELVDTMSRFETQMAQSLSQQWYNLYQHLEDDFDLGAKGVGNRSLKNTALYYLAKVSNPEISEWLALQAQSKNMTLKLGALRAMVFANHALLETALTDFDGAWRHDSLVMDKWFAIQALRKDESAVERLRDLFKHPRFDKGNPNRVRALVGSFARLNPKQFHRLDGQGYQLLGDLLVELNALNPQNASRMLTPFMSWKRFDTVRATLIRAQLQRLADLPNLSDDLFEKVEKALKG